MNFAQNLTNNDSINLYFTSGKSATITIYNNQSNTPPQGPVYGSGVYGGTNPALVSIPLSNLVAPQSGFDLDIVVSGAISHNANIDWVYSLWTPRSWQFAQDAYINQTFNTSAHSGDDVAYYLNYTNWAPSFAFVQQATVTVRFNGTPAWGTALTGTFPATQVVVPVPHSLLQNGGSWNISFDLYLSISANSTNNYNFTLYVDNANLYKTPDLNLLDDSQVLTGFPWKEGTNSTSYYGSVSNGSHLIKFGTNSSGGPAANGGANLNQTFSKATAMNNFTLVFNYYSFNMTNIANVNFTVDINGTVLATRNITAPDTAWQQARLNFNSSAFASGNGSYTLNCTMNVTIASGVPNPPGWVFYMTNISLFQNWNSTLANTTTFNGVVSAGAITKLVFYYNSSNALSPNVPIPDAITALFNNLTGKVWGLDQGGTTAKYQVINAANGNYTFIISTAGYGVGNYTLAFGFLRNNFPDKYFYAQLSILGTPANVTCSAGAYYNSTDGMYYVAPANIPYINDTTHSVTIFVTDNVTGVPILNAFVQSNLGGNLLKFTEIYKQTGNPADEGYYAVYMDTTSLSPRLAYNLINFTIIVSAANYSASAINLTTEINPLPTSLSIPAIDPFYEDSSFTLSAFFEDTFHNTGISNSNVTWSIGDTFFNGSLFSVFLGFYAATISVQGLEAGNYNITVIGENLPDYEQAAWQIGITILDKYNVTVDVTTPASDVVEGNDYVVGYNYSLTELFRPLAGELVNFNINYTSLGLEQIYNAYTGSDGTISVTISPPVGETNIIIMATYLGEYNISAVVNLTSIAVRPRYVANVVLLTQTIPPDLNGQSGLTLAAQLQLANGTLVPIANATLTFQLGSSIATAITGPSGVAQAYVQFPAARSFTVTVAYLGSSFTLPTSNTFLLPTFIVTLNIMNKTFAPEYVGESNVLVVAQLLSANGTPVVGATLTFQVGSSVASAVTGSDGVAEVLITLPTEGTFMLNVTYAGTYLVGAASGTSQSFSITSPASVATRQFVQNMIWVLLVTAIAVSTYFTIQRGVIRPRQRARQAEYALLMNRFEDARNILLLIVINKESGTEIYSKALGGVPVDPTLVSGFLQAITSFSNEILTEERAQKLAGPKHMPRKSSFPDAQTLAFHHFKIVVQEGPHIRVALLLLKNPSKNVLNSMQKFLELVENKFGPRVEELRGRQLDDEEIWDFVDKHFEPSLTYLHLLDFEAASTFPAEKWDKIVMKEIQRAPYYGEAYLDAFQEEVSSRYIGKQLELAETCLALRRRQVLVPLNPRYMEFRLGIKKAIETLPDLHKEIIKGIAEGQRDPTALKDRAHVTREQLNGILLELKDLGMITDDLHLDMAGKVVYTTLRCGESCNM